LPSAFAVDDFVVVDLSRNAKFFEVKILARIEGLLIMVSLLAIGSSGAQTACIGGCRSSGVYSTALEVCP